jgi:16S rRNA (adenine1518-N6/adenine1519-N6)-dimethyltransferase
VSEAFPDPRALLKRHGLAAKKSWGQNFLIADRVYRAITDATVSADDDWVVELGAGLGTLTMRLAERVPEGKVLAVERDRELAVVLRAELGNLDNVEIVEDNALTYDLGTVARWHGGPVVVCGNLPYHLAAQILLRIVAVRTDVSRAVVMIQREMADRLLAEPGTKAWGALGALIRAYADVDSILKVGPGSFHPAPKVDSTVIRIRPLPGGAPRAPIADEAAFADVVHGAFAQRRKTLRNSLRSRWPDEQIAAALTTTGIDGGRRGETLSIAELAALTAALPPRPPAARGRE